MRRLGAIALAALALAAPAAAAEPQTSLADIEDEVMCTICGTTLQLSEAPQANQERELINRLIAAGMTKDQIKDALVDEYGSEVLAVPSTDGFDLAAWIVPIAGILIALACLAVAVPRWRANRAAEEPGPGDSPPRLDAEDEERLRADISRYD